MRFFKDFKSEIKLFLIVALVAVVISVGGILLVRGMTPVPVVEGKALIFGKAIVLSDAMNVPNVPITEGTIVSIPEERFRSFTNEVERQIEGSLLQRDSILSYVAASSLLDQQGEFELEMDPGAYVLCYFSHPVSTEAVRLEACAKTHLDAGERLSVRVETMFGSYIAGEGVEMIPLSDIYPLESNSSDISDLTKREVEGWQTYRNEEFGFEVRYPLSYTINPSTDEEPCFLIARSESSCALALTITADKNSYAPKGYFYAVDGADSVSIRGQVDRIEFDSQINAWVSKAYLSDDDILEAWDYTNFGKEIIKTFNGGSHVRVAIYIIADHARDRVAIFTIPAALRLRCDLLEQESKRDACENFYQSAIDEYGKGEDMVQTWLPKGYFEAVYKDAENMISTFRFIE